MESIRTQRVASQMKHVIAQVVAHELKDPRCGFITITSVKVASDLKTARVNFSVLGSDAEKRTAWRALKSARGYIQARLAQETKLKYTPVISLHLDESAERDIELVQRIDRAVQADRRAAAAKVIRAAAAGSIPPDLAAEVSREAGSEAFVEFIAALLTDLINVDTSPRADVAAAAASERACLGRVEAAIRESWPDDVHAELLPINPAIATDPSYTLPAHTAGADGVPLAVEAAYAGRANLNVVLPRAEPPGALAPPPAERLAPLRLAFNAHVDTLPPHLPASRQGDLVFGRGACDAKGQVAMIVGMLRLLRRLRQTRGLRLRADLSAQFVIDEETGGNGSLSLALDPPSPFEGIVVCEATDFRIYTANRGAVWYRAELTAPPDQLLELAAHVVLALEDEGRAVKAESDHPLFPTRPVQTNHGVIGPFGSAPSSVNDRVEFCVSGARLDHGQTVNALGRGIEKYAALYGDKATQADPATGQPKLAEHFAVEQAGGGFRVRVRGIAGHMGSLDLCDNAITKTAYLVRALTELRSAGGDVTLALAGHSGSALVLEGAQGFLPPNTTREMAKRLTLAGERAAARFARQEELGREVAVEMSFDRLHNNPFVRAADIALAVYTEESRKRAGVEVQPHPAGWETSCDARLFAEAFRDRDVIVFGPGQLRHAHAPDEQISLRDIAAGAEVLTFLALDAAGYVAAGE